MTDIESRARSRGQSLVIVLGAIVVLTVLAAWMAAKVEVLSQASAQLRQQASLGVAEANALAVVMQWIATHPPGHSGWGTSPDLMLAGDGREYSLPDGTLVSVQDQRGLLSLNIVERPLMRNLLASTGVAPSRIDPMIDVVADYTDTDSLKRLSGAEAPDYAALGLSPPRNDWIASVRELGRMPIWVEEIRRNPKILGMVSTRRSAGLNPNTVPPALLSALMPGAAPEALSLFVSLRRERPFTDAGAVLRLTGLQMDGDETDFYVGPQVSIRVRQPGESRGREYNALLTLESAEFPWIILENRLWFDWPPVSPSDVPPAPFPGFPAPPDGVTGLLQATR
jgi:general secretion pathway protein K